MRPPLRRNLSRPRCSGKPSGPTSSSRAKSRSPFAPLFASAIRTRSLRRTSSALNSATIPRSPRPTSASAFFSRTPRSRASLCASPPREELRKRGCTTISRRKVGRSSWEGGRALLALSGRPFLLEIWFDEGGSARAKAFELAIPLWIARELYKEFMPAPERLLNPNRRRCFRSNIEFDAKVDLWVLCDILDLICTEGGVKAGELLAKDPRWTRAWFRSFMDA